MIYNILEMQNFGEYQSLLITVCKYIF